MRFFTLDDPLSGSAFQGSVGGGKVGEFWKVQSGALVSASAPIEVFHHSGRRLQDFVWTAAAVPLINERVRDALAEHKLLGWGSYRIRLFDKDGKSVPGYCGLAVTGRCASIGLNKRADALVYKTGDNGVRMPYFVGLRFDLNTWDGSDLFMGADRKTGWVVASERIEKLFKRLKVTNCKFTPVENVELLTQKSDIEPVENRDTSIKVDG